MEHRYSERKPLAIDVCLRHQSAGKIYTRTLNISFGGMLIERNEPHLPVNTYVEVSFPLNHRDAQKLHQTRAMVIHSGPHGAGLMFDETDDDLHVTLSNLMTDPQGQTQTKYA